MPKDLKPPQGPHVGPPPLIGSPPIHGSSFEKGYTRGLDHGCKLSKLIIREHLKKVEFIVNRSTSSGMIKVVLKGNLEAIEIFCNEVIEKIDKESEG